MEGQDVDPSFAQHFARRVWQFAQEKEYFEERAAVEGIFFFFIFFLSFIELCIQSSNFS